MSSRQNSSSNRLTFQAKFLINKKIHIRMRAMPPNWKNAFSRPLKALPTPLHITDLEELKRYLDLTHIKYCLLKPYSEQANYPLIDVRDLMPSFESELWEYKNLPGFSMVAFERELVSFNEIFQYDALKTEEKKSKKSSIIRQNTQTVLARLAKQYQEQLKTLFADKNLACLENYPDFLPLLCQLDRAHVIARNDAGFFNLAGVFASFPSDIDGEIKRFGLKAGKFKLGDNTLYETNRMFVYQFLMELYGFPVTSERRTSATLFSRRLHKTNERFLIRVLGQSDRVLTTIWAPLKQRYYPSVEKIALIRLDPEHKDLIDDLNADGYFVDRAKLVVIVRIRYKQHRYNPDNIHQDRALSVEYQEIIHPKTGFAIKNINFLKDTTTLLMLLTDVVRGEFTGHIIYKRTELIEGTDTDEKRLKFLDAWLTKNQRRLINYGDDFYGLIIKVLDGYLKQDANQEVFENHDELYNEIIKRTTYIRQARTVQELEEIVQRNYKGNSLSYVQCLTEAVTIVRELKFELTTYFDVLVKIIINHINTLLDNNYLRRMYIEPPEEALTPKGHEIRKLYRRLVSLSDEIQAIQKSRSSHEK